ncbi:hypothetical protein ACFYNO_20145 [Kitasatospora sp. NPDC006697]|uniref:hypothetical protein n=1 Tax=Kitasatospora sp. NPDC006697 TaxID=3364020 RepID=UPI0036B7437C
MTTPIATPSPAAFVLGRCHCCQRPTLVAPGPVITTAGGLRITIPWCLAGFERANRMLHRAALLAARAAERNLLT